MKYIYIEMMNEIIVNKVNQIMHFTYSVNLGAGIRRS